MSWHRLLIVPAALLAAVAAGASQFSGATNIECAGGQAALARHWEALGSEGFEKGFGGWSTTNYEGGLKLEVSTEQPHAGVSSFLLTGAKGGDTGLELTSPGVPVQANSPYELHFWLRSNRSFAMVSGHGENYQSRIEWRTAAGELLTSTPIPWSPADERWHEVVVRGETPLGAVTAGLRFGFDHPNIGPGEYLALDDISLLSRTAASGYEPSGEFVSRPLRLRAAGAALVRWEGQAPPRTTLSLQVRFAADDNGGPGPWGPFLGPGGANTFFTSPGEVKETRPWAQYRVRLATADRAATAAIRQVTIAGVTDSKYNGLDNFPPALVSYGPTRFEDPSTAFRFTLKDDGVGCDPRTVRLSVDETPATLTAGAPGEYRWQPAEPLAPPLNHGNLQAWQTRNFTDALQITAAAPRTAAGSASLLVTRAAGETDTAFSLVSPEIPVVAGEKYTLRLWLRSDMDLSAVDDRGEVGLRWLGADGKPAGERVRVLYGGRNTEWHEVRQEVTAPGQAASAVIALGWDSPNIANRQFVQFAEPDLDGPHPKRSAGPNLHQLRVSARDFAGNDLSRTCYLLVKAAPATGRVTIRDDGVTLIDGKPFFPIGIYSISKRPANNNSYDTAFAELRAAGFNLAHTYASARNADFAEFYAAAARSGMKLWVCPETGNNSPNAWGAVTTVARECNEPALLAWYLADDTAGWIGAEDLRRVHEAVMDVDPYHMTVQADGISAPGDERYVRYIDSTTGFLPELYPIREVKGNHVADVIRGMKNVQTAWQAAGRVTPVWAIIQDFEGWGWKRFPTNAEERCMVYLALIHGAQGMTWYTYAYREDKHGAPWDPQVWAYLKGIATELSSLSEVLTSRDPREQPRGEVLAGPAKGDLGYPSLNLRLKRWNGSWYLLAANSAEQTITARMTVPGLKGEAEVLFEAGRKATAEGGGLEDTFAPLEVHVYRWQ